MRHRLQKQAARLLTCQKELRLHFAAANRSRVGLYQEAVPAAQHGHVTTAESLMLPAQTLLLTEA